MKEWRVAVVLAIIVIAGFIVMGFFLRNELKNTRQGGPSPEALKKLATELESRGVWEGAADTYLRYLDIVPLEDSERASINYRLGVLYLDRLANPSKALPHLIMARQLSGEGGISSDADKRIVEAFERLGRSLDARTYLREASALESKQPDGQEGNIVIAKVGEREITLRELEEDIQDLPPQLQEQMNTPDRKMEFLQGMIIKILFLNAARREGIDNDPEVARLARNAVDAAIMAKYQEREIERKILVTDADARAYYEAHKDEFVRKDEKGKERKLSYGEAKEEARARLINERRRSLLDELINRLQQAEKVEIYSDRISAP